MDLYRKLVRELAEEPAGKADASMKPPLPAARAAGLDKTLLRQIADLADDSCIDLGLGELVFPDARRRCWKAFPARSAAGLWDIRPTPGFRSSGRGSRPGSGPDVDPGSRLRHVRVPRRPSFCPSPFWSTPEMRSWSPTPGFPPIRKSSGFGEAFRFLIPWTGTTDSPCGAGGGGIPPDAKRRKPSFSTARTIPPERCTPERKSSGWLKS